MNEKNPQEEQDLQKKLAMDQMRHILVGLNNCVKNATLYNADHPSVAQSCENLNGVLREAFRDRVEINITHSDGLFIIEDQLFIQESITLFDLLKLLEDAKVSGINILPDPTSKETKDFVLFLLRVGNQKNNPNPAQKGFVGKSIRTLMQGQVDNEFDIKQSKFARAKRIETMNQEWNKRAADVFEKLIQDQSFHLSSLSEPLEKLIDIIHIDPETFVTTLAKPAPKLHVQHAVNTMIFSIFLGQRLNFDVPTIKALAISALFHDVGRFLLPSDFETGYHLNKGDIDFIQLHTRDGASFLAGVPGLPIMAVRVALEHHIGYDGKGYPELPSNHQPHFFSQIVGLADFVSWRTITENRYHKPISTTRLIRAVLRRMGTQFHPLLVKLLIPMLGIYPAGTKIRLDSGEMAISLESNIRNITRPGICVAGADGKWSYKKITEFNQSDNASFKTNIQSFRGQEESIDSLLHLIPNRTDAIS